ncbi:MAG TPA: MaoC family dehydratase [Candidatus Sulfotelmatobacter sp.]|nr:MaoC family dehydratase [Candidatus Sulfotelmatobacter sp.]
MAACVAKNPRSLKEFAGQEIAVTPWFELTEDRIRQFAEATEDRQWIHVDPERAKLESPYGRTIAHGFLTLSLTSYFISQAVEIRYGVRLAVNYGLNRVRFPAPVRANTRIRARVALLRVQELPESVEAIYSVSIETEGAAKPSCVAECVVRYYP